jgi:uncharacterized zinc-type alcohol dehydrogenase-like protein
MRIQSMAALARGAPLEPWSYEAPELGANEVRVKVLSCGICRSDLHMVNDDWRLSRYPLVPGHEVVGTVEAAGSAVAGLLPGARVGIGWQSGACLDCQDCAEGADNLCAQSRGTIVHGRGGFADRIVVDARYAFPIPEAISTDEAGPLLCGGITVYAALRHAGMSSAQDVGVVGVGGLGHLAIQFASRLGNKVVAFTTSPEKAAGAEALGASEVALLKDGKPPRLARPLDIILVTAPAGMQWGSFLGRLRRDGTLTFVASAGAPLGISADALMSGRKRVTGSLIGSRHEIREMLDVAARFGVRPRVEVFPLAQANEAMARVRENAVRHRAVLRVA